MAGAAAGGAAGGAVADGEGEGGEGEGGAEGAVGAHPLAAARLQLAAAAVCHPQSPVHWVEAD